MYHRPFSRNRGLGELRLDEMPHSVLSLHTSVAPSVGLRQALEFPSKIRQTHFVARLPRTNCARIIVIGTEIGTFTVRWYDKVGTFMG